MDYYAGIDVSLECSSVCVVDASGKILREAKVASEPEALIAWFRLSGFALERVGLEAGPLSQWLFAAMREANSAVELLETRHVRKAFEAMQGIGIGDAENVAYHRGDDTGNETAIRLDLRDRGAPKRFDIHRQTTEEVERQ